MPFKDKEKKKEYMKEYYNNNKEKLKEQKKKYYENTKTQKTQEPKNPDEIQTINIIKNIKNKIWSCRAKDILKNREFNIDYEYISNLLITQEGKCNKCKVEYKMDWEIPRDPLQFSINRLDNDIGHIKQNCEITCYNCNNEDGYNTRKKKGSIFFHKNSYCFTYYVNKEQKTKSFSIKKYGEIEAKRLVEELRNKIYPS